MASGINVFGAIHNMLWIFMPFIRDIFQEHAVWRCTLCQQQAGRLLQYTHYHLTFLWLWIHFTVVTCYDFPAGLHLRWWWWSSRLGGDQTLVLWFSANHHLLLQGDDGDGLEEEEGTPSKCTLQKTSWSTKTSIRPSRDSIYWDCWGSWTWSCYTFDWVWWHAGPPGLPGPPGPSQPPRPSASPGRPDLLDSLVLLDLLLFGRESRCISRETL